MLSFKMTSKIPVSMDYRNPSSANVPDAVGQHKQGNAQNNLPRKNHGVKAHKGPFRIEAELRERNRALEATNEELRREVSQSKDRVTQLEQQYRDLQEDNKEIRKQLESCTLLLLSGNVDPVLGYKVAETKEQNEEQREDVMNIAGDLLCELNDFNKQAARHRWQLEQVQDKIKKLKTSHEQHLLERETFSLNVGDVEQALEDAEALLQEL